MKSEIKEIALCFVVALMFCGIGGLMWSFLNAETSATVHKMEWKGDRWHLTDVPALPKTLHTAYGFAFGAAAHGRSCTIIVPHNRLGFAKEARVHWWQSDI